MPRVMTIDDSKAVRSIIAKQLASIGVDIEESEDGEQGLAKLEDISVDLILLDVTMPVMDGPTMLSKLRERGDKTPVIMLTSESKKSIIAEVLKHGVDDYILKPFKPEELLVKVRTALKITPPPGMTSPAAAPPPPSEPSAGDIVDTSAAPAGTKFVDVAVVDAMENVGKRIRSLLPQHVSLESFASGQAALTACRDRIFKVMLVDANLADVEASVFIGQLKVVQPHAMIVAMALKGPGSEPADLKKKGFVDVLYKPFSQEVMEDFVLQYFDKQELLVVEDNCFKIGAYVGRKDREERYFNRLNALVPPALQKAAAACFDQVVIDLSKALLMPDRTPKLLVSISTKAQAVGLSVSLVGPPDLPKVLSAYEETKSLRVFSTIAEAKEAA